MDTEAYTGLNIGTRPYQTVIKRCLGWSGILKTSGGKKTMLLPFVMGIVPNLPRTGGLMFMMPATESTSQPTAN